MATANELLRAAEHMRQRGEALSLTGIRFKTVHGQANIQAAEALEREAVRLMAAERRVAIASGEASGHLPFSVLRRAYVRLEVSHRPSTRWLEKHGGERSKQECISIRERWAELLIEESSAP